MFRALAVFILLGGGGWAPFCEPSCRRERATKPPTAESIANAMTIGDGYAVVSRQRDELFVRRCSRERGREDCEVTRVVQGRPVERIPAAHPRAVPPDATRETLAANLATKLRKAKVRPLARQDDRVTRGTLGAYPRGTNYYFEVVDGSLKIVHRMSSNAPEQTQVALLRLTEPVRVTTYVDYDGYSLFALRLLHGPDDGPQSTSWVVFERRENSYEGHTWVLASTTGQQATVVSEQPVKQPRLKPSAPMVVTPPTTPPEPPPALQLPAATPCTSTSDCQTFEQCVAPEEHQWNRCGQPIYSTCPEDLIGDSCGNCFIPCESDDDCDNKRCNGSFCVSPTVCLSAQKPV